MNTLAPFRSASELQAIAENAQRKIGAYMMILAGFLNLPITLIWVAFG